jgi:hypothetical protein
VEYHNIKKYGTDERSVLILGLVNNMRWLENKGTYGLSIYGYYGT